MSNTRKAGYWREYRIFRRIMDINEALAGIEAGHVARRKYYRKYQEVANGVDDLHCADVVEMG